MENPGAMVGPGYTPLHISIGLLELWQMKRVTALLRVGRVLVGK